MKTLCRRALATAASFLSAAALLAQTNAQEAVATSEAKTNSPALRVLDRDANSTTVGWTEQVTNTLTGEVTQQNHSYVTVGTGLNYQDESGAWRESEDLIELLPDGSAAALRGQHKVRFSPNLNAAGAISLTSVSNRVFRSHPLALYYLNAETGERALVARVKDSIGEFHPPNQLVYPDCLEGAKADYRVTYSKAGLEADLVLLAQLPAPESFFGTKASVRLEWVTEFLDPPAPQFRTRVLKQEADAALRQSMAEPDLIDETLDFGDAWFPLGRAFVWDGATRSDTNTPAEIRVFDPASDTNQVSVAKRWLSVDQRNLMTESVDWSDIASRLDALPPAGRVASASNLKDRVSKDRQLPAVKMAAKRSAKPMRVASAPYRAKGFVLDYVLVTGSGSYTFASGSTYYISPSAGFSGTVTFQPNCTIKFTNNAYLLMYGPIVCNGTATLPSILTSKDENLFGETILGSTGNPTFAASQAMWVYYIPTDTTVSHMQIRWAQKGIQDDANPNDEPTHTVQSVKLQQCQTGIYANACRISLSGVTKCGVASPITTVNGGSYTGSITDDCAGDTDSDGLPDSWEMLYFKTLAYNGTGDADGDGSSNLQEYLAGTNPVQPLVLIGEPLGASSRRTGLVISEIMYNPPTTGFSPPNNSEYVEIYNSELISKNIGGFALVVRDKNDSVVLNQPIPTGTIILPGGFAVFATPSLPNDAGTIQLTNRWGAVLLEAKYSDESPWPKQADGAGHSLVLVRPSYGEGDPRAWGPSDLRGGSPGKGEAYQTEPARSVVINEFLANPSSGSDFIELYNHANSSIDLTGYHLSDNDANLGAFTISGAKAIVPARGFVSFSDAELGFGLSASGEQIFFSNPSLTRVIDAVEFKAQRSGISMGRYPDGAPGFHELVSPTLQPAGANSVLLLPNIVINEIMYHPMANADPTLAYEDLEYVELFNRGATAISLNNWSIDGIGYNFPATGAPTLSAGGYLVVAKKAANLIPRYPGVLSLWNGSTGNTVGDYGGMLSNSGERVALKDNAGVIIDEVTYGDGGRWGQWSDGGGSSLELIDPRSDNRLPSNWADSDDSAEAQWTTVNFTGLLDNGMAGVSASALEVILEGPGECLIDDVQVLDSGGGQHVSTPNSNFESGIGGWVMQGNHRNSYLDTSTGYNSSKCLRLRASGRGDTGPNRAWVLLSPALGTSGNATIQAKVKWVRGCPTILLRTHGNWLEAEVAMNLPSTLGTPGAQNSRYAANTGPAIFDVAHSPVLPALNQSVVVSARIHDPDGVASPTLYYRDESVAPPGSFTAVAMVDSGAGGDAIQNDGVYSATITGPATSKTYGFYIVVSDSFVPSASTTFPTDAPTRECLVRFGETPGTTGFPTYRIWMTQSTFNTWADTLNTLNNPKQSKEHLDLTFVYDNRRVIYNAGGAFSGGQYTTDVVPYDTPTGKTCGYELAYPSDDRFLGADEAVFDWPIWGDKEATPPSRRPGQNEQAALWIADQLGLPNENRRFFHLYVNGLGQSQRSLSVNPDNSVYEIRLGSKIYEDLQQPNSDFLAEWFPTNYADGDLFKFDNWNEYLLQPNAAYESQQPPYIGNYTSGAVKKKAAYRWNWRKRADSSNGDYSNLYVLMDTLLLTTGDKYAWQVDALLDVEQWMRVLAFEDCVGSGDSWGNKHNKNVYAYKPKKDKWKLVPYDLDATMGVIANSYGDSTTGLFQTPPWEFYADQLNKQPPFLRAYWRAIKDAVNGPMLSGNFDPIVDARFAALQANGVVAGTDTINVTSPITQTDTDKLKTYVSGRRTFLNGQLATYDNKTFAITTSGGANFETGQNPVELQGTAQVAVKTIKINSVAYPVTWFSDGTGDNQYKVDNWKVCIRLNAGANVLSVQGFDRLGNLTDTRSITVTYNGSQPYPVLGIVINEWMANNTSAWQDPANDQFQSWFELYNTSTCAFDLSGYTLTDDLATPGKYVIPSGTILPPSGFLLVWADNQAGPQEASGDLHVNFQLNPAGEAIGLYTPGGTVVGSLTFNSQSANVSQGRSPDGAAPPFQTMLTTTPRRPNIYP